MSPDQVPPPDLPGFTFAGERWSGGYSDVFLYDQHMPRRKVAVKVLKAQALTDAMRAQFTNEANAMAELADHPNIVQVIAADVAADGRPFLVMSYYPRPNLGVRAASERFAVSEVLRIGIQIASAVETAHRAGILHRDIKPANILTSQYGHPGLTDFGIAGELTATEDDDDLGVSVPWSPPEVLYATAPASVRSDVYSLGATLWHLLVGRSPFEIAGGDNSQNALMRRIRDLPVPSTGRADVPGSLQRLLAQSMATDPIARPASALEFARSLQAVEQEQRLPRTEIVVLNDEQPEARPATPRIAEVDATRARAPVRVVPPTFEPPPTVPPSFEPAMPSFEPATISRQARASQPAPVTGERERAQAPRERPLDSTVHRAATPTSHAAEAPSVRRGVRWPVAVGLAVAAVVVAIVVGVVLSGGHGTSATGSPTTSAAGTGPVDDGGPPGPLTITGTRPTSTSVRFTWTYGNHFATDTFKWQLQDGSKSGITAQQTLDLPDPAGAKLCLQVVVEQAGGANATVGWPYTGCSP